MPAPICIDDSLANAIKHIPGVKHVERYALSQGILKTDADFMGIALKGVGSDYDVTFLNSNLTAGTLPKFSSEKSSYQLVISQQMANKLNLKVNDRITGLEMGADDYLVKPFEMKELMARINAVLRRSEIPDDTKKKLVFDKLEINLDSYELLVDGKKVDTPPKELELLYHLASTPNRVYTRNQLLDEVWGFDYFGDSRTVDVHIKRLREKVENVSDQWALKTVWGVGYKFEVK